MKQLGQLEVGLAAQHAWMYSMLKLLQFQKTIHSYTMKSHCLAVAGRRAVLLWLIDVAGLDGYAHAGCHQER